jgi:hypothetical protein
MRTIFAKGKGIALGVARVRQKQHDRSIVEILGVVMNTLSFGAVGVVLAALSYGTAKHQPAESGAGTQIAATCFKSGEQTSGMNKICYYDCMGSQAAITIKSVQLCPLSINR